MLADDHPMITVGLRRVLAGTRRFEVVGEAADGTEAYDLAIAKRPDIVLSDFTMPIMGVCELARMVLAAVPDTLVAVYTMHDTLSYAVNAARSGASGYILKSTSTATLVDALQQIYDGEPWYPTHLQAALEQRFDGDEVGQTPPESKLTRRERAYLYHLGCGYKPQDIAKNMAVTVSTASTYRSRCLRKLGLSTTAQLVRYCVEHKIGPTRH